MVDPRYQLHASRTTPEQLAERWRDLSPIDRTADDYTVAAFDATTVFPRTMLVRRMGSMSPTRIHELCDALAAATDC